MSSRWVRLAAPLLCLAGLGMSLYLTIAHYNARVILACPETGIVNCAKVTESPQSAILGVPVWAAPFWSTGDPFPPRWPQGCLRTSRAQRGRLSQKSNS